MNDTAITRKPVREPGYYGRIGKLGGAAVKEKHGSPFFHALGVAGGNATKAQQDPEYYARIGRLGGKVRHRNWLAAKKAEAIHD